MRSGLARPPLFTVGWHDAIFEHYRVLDEDALRSRLPTGVELDHHEGAAYLSVVSFRMHDMRLRGRWRLPVAHTYPQINVRVYARAGDRAGVFFLRNLVSSRIATTFGRWLYGMPYRYQRVELGDGDAGPWCRARLGPALRHAVAGIRGPRLTGHEHDPDSLLFFLVERYPLYSRRGAASYEAQMLHPPWALHQLEVVERTHAILEQLGLRGAVEPLDAVHCSPGVDVLIWPAVPLGRMPALVASESLFAARAPG